MLLHERLRYLRDNSGETQQHVAAGNGVDVIAEIVVRTENELFVLGHGADHLHGIAGGDAAVGECLHVGCSVDITDDLVAGVLSLVAGQIGSRTAVGQ